MADPITTPEYEGPDRRRWSRAPGGIVWPRWAIAVLLTIAYVAIMVPLGFVLMYGARADGRAERSGRTVCELSTTVAHLSDTIDATIAALLPPDNSDEADDAITSGQLDAVEALRETVTEGRADAADARAECRPGTTP